MYISTYQHASYKKIQAIKKEAKKGVQKSRKQRQPRYSYSITVSFFGKRAQKKCVDNKIDVASTHFLNTFMNLVCLDQLEEQFTFYFFGRDFVFS